MHFPFCFVVVALAISFPAVIGQCVIPRIENGTFGQYEISSDLSTNHSEKFNILEGGSKVKSGETVILRCNENFAPSLDGESAATFKMRGSEQQVTCKDRKWSLSMKCRPVICEGEPPEIENGFPLIVGRFHGQIVFYACNDLYTHDPFGDVMCYYGKWKGSPATCVQEDLSRCKTDELNFPGLIKPTEKFIDNNENLKISCEYGYEVADQSLTISCEMGKWNIEKNPCVREHVSHCNTEELNFPGFIKPTVKFVDDKKSFKISCADGYQVADQNLRLSCELGKWNIDKSPCVRALVTQCNTDELNFPGFIKPTEKFIDNNKNLKISCEDGYQVVDQSLRISCERGKWKFDKNPCVRARLTQCNTDELNLPGFIKPPEKFIDNNKNLKISCENGYQVADQSLRISCEMGKWKIDENPCVKAKCEDPGPLANGRIGPIGQINNEYYAGSAIHYSCQSPYYLNGTESISCLETGDWSAPKPQCIKVDACPDLPTPVGGFVTYISPQSNRNTQRTAFHQPPGLGSRTVSLHGGFEAPAPRNIQETFTKTETVSLPPGLHVLGTSAKYECESRYYKLEGSRTRRCQSRGRWSGRAATCIPVCGRSASPRTPSIVNGNATDIGQWPWQAGISRDLKDHRSWFIVCGASLLNEQWVITAAHCVTFTGTILSMGPAEFKVYLGKYHRDDSKDDEYVQVRGVQEIHIHRDYDPTVFDADIALLQLDFPVQLNARVQPICLPTPQTTRYNLVEGKRGVVTGWGRMENSLFSETLQQAVLPVVSSDACEDGYIDSGMLITVTENMFCAGYEEGKSDTCGGDSGGPMVFNDETSREKKWVLEGIVSWGSPRGCGKPKQYAGFTTVSNFLDWIHLYI